MSNTILVIDEFNMVKMELLSILKDKDIKISGVKDSYEAEKTIAFDKSIRIIMWVINSSDLNKYEEIKVLTAKRNNIPVFVVSKNADKKYILSAIASGAKEYIARPFEKNTVLKKINEYVNIDGDKRKSGADTITYTLEELLAKEIKLASRGNYQVSMFMLSIIEEDSELGEVLDLLELFEIIIKFTKQKLRETDTIVHYKDNLIFILPFCKLDGIEKVKKKIFRTIEDNSTIKKMMTGYRMVLESVIYPENGKTKDALLKSLEKKIKKLFV